MNPPLRPAAVRPRGGGAAPVAPLDVRKIREDFPILWPEKGGRRLVYLDSAATSQKPTCVIERMRRYYERENANIHRGTYRLAEEATVAYEAVREKVARLLNLSDPRGVVFTRGTTEAINLVAGSYGRATLRAGDEILLTEMEHHSNLIPWIRLAEEKGARLRHIPFDVTGCLDMTRLDDLLTDRTRIVSLIHISNVLGTVNPVAEIASRAHAAGAIVLLDAAQSVPNRPFRFDDLGVDLVAFSGHKMLGPTGVGVLAGRPELLDTFPPYQGGGEMIAEVHFDRATYHEIPWRFEAGTPNIAGVIGLGAAIEYLEGVGMAAIETHVSRISALCYERLAEIPDLTLLGPTDTAGRGDVVAFVDPKIHPHDMAQVLDREGVAVRAGHHCAQPLHRKLGLAGSTRASIYLYNDEEDIEALVRGVQAARAYFARR